MIYFNLLLILMPWTARLSQPVGPWYRRKVT